MGYHTVPAKILDGTKELAAWAEKASAVVRLAAASRAKSHPRKKRSWQNQSVRRENSQPKNGSDDERSAAHFAPDAAMVAG